MLTICLRSGIYLLLICSTVFPQQQPRISVSVIDQLSATVVGAEVVLKHNGKVIRRVRTPKHNRVVFSKLNYGIYKILIEGKNFERFETIVNITSNKKDIEITAKLKVAAIKVELDVDDETSFIDGSARVLGEDDIRKLPDDIVLLRRALEEMAGPTAIGGRTPITVEGFEDSELPPKEAIRQIRFDRNIFSAQHDNPYGGGIQVYTKASVDKFRFGFVFNYGNSKLNAGNPYISTKLPYYHANSRAYVVGPLFNKKTSFIFDYRHSDNHKSGAINAVVLDSTLRPVEFQEVFRSPAVNDDARFVIKTDIFDKHSVYLNYRFVNSRDQGNGVGDFSLPTRAFDRYRNLHDLKVAETFFVNQSIVNQARFQLKYLDNQNRGNFDKPALIVQDAFSSGGAQIDDSSSDFYFKLSNDTIWGLGKHELRFGGGWKAQRIEQWTKSNFGGTYFFTGKLAPVLDANNLPVKTSQGKIINTQVSSLESYRRTLVFSNLGYSPTQIRLLGGGANHLTISGGSPLVASTQIDASGYLQNNFHLSRQMMFSLGVRAEYQTNIQNNFDIAPRIGIAWSPKGDSKKILNTLPTIRVGFGLFYSRFGIDNVLQLEKSNANDRAEYFITDSTLLNLFPKVPNPNTLTQFALPKISRNIADRVKSPLQTLFNIVLVKELPRNLSLNLMFSKGANRRQLVTRNIQSGGFFYETSSGSKKDWSFFNVGLSLQDSINLFSSEIQIESPRISYGYRKSKDDVVQGSGNPFDAFDFSNEFSNSTDDGTHRISVSFSLNAFFGINLIHFINYQTAGNFNIITGLDTNEDGFFTERPGFSTSPNEEGVIQTAFGLFDPTPEASDQIIPRNLGQGFDSFNWDTSISKSFLLGGNKAKNIPGKYAVSLSVFIRNITNTNNQGFPIGNISSPNFLRALTSSSGNASSISTAAGTFTGASGRTLNFSASLRF